MKATFLLCCLTLQGLLLQGVWAVERIWTGATNDLKFETPTNWEGNVAPQAGDSVLINLVAKPGITIDYALTLSTITSSSHLFLRNKAAVFTLGDATGKTSTSFIAGVTFMDGPSILLKAKTTLTLDTLRDISILRPHTFNNTISGPGKVIVSKFLDLRGCVVSLSGADITFANQLYEYEPPQVVLSSCSCAQVWDPVCGQDRKTYINSCRLACSNVPLLKEGECGNFNGLKYVTATGSPLSIITPSPSIVNAYDLIVQGMPAPPQYRTSRISPSAITAVNGPWLSASISTTAAAAPIAVLGQCAPGSFAITDRAVLSLGVAVHTLFEFDDAYLLLDLGARLEVLGNIGLPTLFLHGGSVAKFTGTGTTLAQSVNVFAASTLEVVATATNLDVVIMLALHPGSSVAGAGNIGVKDTLEWAASSLALYSGNMGLGQVNGFDALVTQRGPNGGDSNTLTFGVVNGNIHFVQAVPADLVTYSTAKNLISVFGGELEVQGSVVGKTPLLTPSLLCEKEAMVFLSGFNLLNTANVTHCTLFANDYGISQIRGLVVSLGGILDGPGEVQVLNTFLWNGGEVKGTGFLNILLPTSTAIFRPEKLSLILRRRVLNRGTILWNQGIIDVRGGDIQNYNIMQVVGSVLIQCHYVDLGQEIVVVMKNSLVNHGTVEIDPASSFIISDCYFTNEALISVDNTGIFKVQWDDIYTANVTAMYSNSSFVSTPSSKLAVVAGSSIVLDAKTVFNPGAQFIFPESATEHIMTVSGHQVVFEGGIAIPHTWVFGGVVKFLSTAIATGLRVRQPAIVTFVDGINSRDVFIEGGRMEGTGLVSVSTSFQWFGGVLTGNTSSGAASLFLGPASKSVIQQSIFELVQEPKAANRLVAMPLTLSSVNVDNHGQLVWRNGSIQASSATLVNHNSIVIGNNVTLSPIAGNLHFGSITNEAGSSLMLLPATMAVIRGGSIYNKAGSKLIVQGGSLLHILDKKGPLEQAGLIDVGVNGRLLLNIPTVWQHNSSFVYHVSAPVMGGIDGMTPMFRPAPLVHDCTAGYICGSHDAVTTMAVSTTAKRGSVASAASSPSPLRRLLAQTSDADSSASASRSFTTQTHELANWKYGSFFHVFNTVNLTVMVENKYNPPLTETMEIMKLESLASGKFGSYIVCGMPVDKTLQGKMKGLSFYGTSTATDVKPDANNCVRQDTDAFTGMMPVPAANGGSSSGKDMEWWAYLLLIIALVVLLLFVAWCAMQNRKPPPRQLVQIADHSQVVEQQVARNFDPLARSKAHAEPSVPSDPTIDPQSDEDVEASTMQVDGGRPWKKELDHSANADAAIFQKTPSPKKAASNVHVGPSTPSAGEPQRDSSGRITTPPPPPPGSKKSKKKKTASPKKKRIEEEEDGENASSGQEEVTNEAPQRRFSESFNPYEDFEKSQQNR